MLDINWNETGIIFNIQRFSLHDGEGIRTLVFLKGCDLRCKWCCNPESQSLNPEILFKDSLCIHCKACTQVCPTGALSLQNGTIHFSAPLCTACGQCVDVCCTDALQLIGKKVTVKEVFEEVLKDQSFYKCSQGGITVSGGEALLQADFIKELFKACQLHHIPTAVETAGFVPSENLQKIAPYTDTFLYDLKVMNHTLHKTYTGKSNTLILKNLSQLAQSHPSIIIRIPVMEGINTTQTNMEMLLSYLKPLTSIREIHLLPYHQLGMNKYRYLDRIYNFTEGLPVQETTLKQMERFFFSKGYKCIIGG